MGPHLHRRLLSFLAAAAGLWLAGSPLLVAQGGGPLRVRVTIAAPHRASAPFDGRLLLMLSKREGDEPRFWCRTEPTPGTFGMSGFRASG